LDVLTNNCDRFPLIWDNPGNSGNLMIGESGEIIAIDNKITGIESQTDIYDNYLRNVRELMTHLMAYGDSKETKHFRKVRDTLNASVGHDIDTQGSLLVQKGFLSVVRKTTEFDIVSYLTEWQEKLDKHFKISSRSVNVVFVETIWNLLKSLYLNPPTLSVGKPTSSTTSGASSSHSNPRVSKNDNSAPKSEYSWKKVKPSGHSPSARRYLQSCFAGSSLYVFGGVNGKKEVLNDLFLYDMANCQWKQLSSPSSSKASARSSGAAVLVKQSLLIFGGCDSTQSPVADVMWEFDIASSVWKSVSVVEGPPARFHHRLVPSSSNPNSLLLFGGCSSEAVYFNDTWEFSLVTNKWTKINATGKTPSQRAGSIVFHSDGHLWVFGGFSSDSNSDHLSDCWKLKDGTSTWQEISVKGSVPLLLRPVGYAFDHHRSLLYVYGGYDGKKAVGTLLQMSLADLHFINVNMWLELDESNVAAVTGSGKSMTPIPRFGNCMAFFGEKILTAFGSASMFLDDIVEFDSAAED